MQEPTAKEEWAAARVQYALELLENILTDQGVTLSTVQRNGLQRVTMDLQVVRRVFVEVEQRRGRAP